MQAVPSDGPTHLFIEYVLHLKIVPLQIKFLRFVICLIMGQLIARPTGGIEKTDINYDYETYGVEGESDYAIDGNSEYGGHYEDMEGTSDRPSTQRITQPKVDGSFQSVDRLYLETQQPKAKKRGKCCICLVIFCSAVILTGLAGNVAFYFVNVAPTGMLLGLPRRGLLS